MGKSLEVKVLIHKAETADNYESQLAFAELKAINPTYHFCFEWDGAVICDEDTEYEACLCECSGGKLNKTDL